MNINNFEIDKDLKKQMNVRTVMVLFKMLYKDGDINQKQYERLINVLKRRVGII